MCLARIAFTVGFCVLFCSPLPSEFCFVSSIFMAKKKPNNIKRIFALRWCWVSGLPLFRFITLAYYVFSSDLTQYLYDVKWVNSTLEWLCDLHSRKFISSNIIDFVHLHPDKMKYWLIVAVSWCIYLIIINVSTDIQFNANSTRYRFIVVNVTCVEQDIYRGNTLCSVVRM